MRAPWRETLYEVIFGHHTRAGKTFDVVLLFAIALSVVAVMLESVSPIADAAGGWLRGLEWVMTVLFTVEYVLRLLCARGAWRYARSFFGIVDLLAILPTYLSIFLPGSHFLLVIRALRLLRVFRILHMAPYLVGANILVTALRQSAPKVVVFIGTVLVIDLVVGAAMYLIEGAEAGFDSIPRAVYWTIVTMTTVGYGDIAPRTVLGQTLAAVLMLLGYAIIAVPTGIVSAELTQTRMGRACPRCGTPGHAPEARFCRDCGLDLGGE